MLKAQPERKPKQDQLNTPKCQGSNEGLVSAFRGSRFYLSPNVAAAFWEKETEPQQTTETIPWGFQAISCWTIEGSIYLYWEILICQQITQLHKAQERSPSYVPEGSKRCKTEASVLLTLGTGCVRHNVKWNMTFYQILSIYTFYHLAVLHSDFLQKAFLYNFKKLSKRKACYTLLFYLNIPWSERKRGTLLTSSCCLWKEELIIEPIGCLNRDRLPHLFLRC